MAAHKYPEKANIGEAILDTLKALMMFLDRDSLEQLPLLLASHIGIVHLLADVVLPFAIAEDTFIKLSVPGVLMLVIAKGTSESRVAAANLLLHYWPFPNPYIIHRKTIQYKPGNELLANPQLVPKKDQGLF
ncbi:unnamed protein product [Strongylus vulgaris]|uniref:Uncharacterized protein n=1 Tax=Strongylus vulgaris TaxID=40348 RepID=A0A3P7LNV6_STRVU|nr:unnamed protein product [Strongylus vulgaris]